MEQTFVLRNTDILKRLLTVLSALPIGGGNLFEVVVRKHKEKRTLDQNAKWHSMVRDLAGELGYTPSVMKTIVKKELGYYRQVAYQWMDDAGVTHDEVATVYAKTHLMSIEQLSTLIEQTYELAASHGVILE